MLYTSNLMESMFLNKFRTSSPTTRALMLSDARNYIADDAFLQLLRNLNIHDVDPKHKNNPDSIYFVCNMMIAYKEMPRFQGEVKNWLGNF